MAFMKKGFKVIGTGLLAFGLAVSSPGISEIVGGNVSHSVEAASVKEFNKAGKLYASASRRSKVIQNVSKGTDVTVLEVRGSWSKVRIGSRTGWTAGRDLSSIVRVTSVEKEFNKTSVLRSSGSTRAKVILKVKAGTKVSVLEVRGSWSKVNVGSKVGWTASRDLRNVTVVEKSIGTKMFVTKTALRTSRSTRSKAVLFVKPGHVASIYEVNGSWSRVKVGSKVGWVASRDLVGMDFEYREVKSGADMRIGVRSTDAVVGKVVAGDFVEYIRSSGSLMQVKKGTVVGWVSKSVLSAEVLERGDADMVMAKLGNDGRFDYVPAKNEYNPEMYVQKFSSTDMVKYGKNKDGKLVVNYWFGDAYGGTSSNSKMREDLMSKQYNATKVAGEVLYGKGTVEASRYASVVTGHVKEIEKLINADWHKRMSIFEQGTFSVNGDKYTYYYAGPSLEIVFE